MKCNICHETIIVPDGEKLVTDSRNIAVRDGDKIICLACSESLMLFDDKPRQIKPKPKPPPKKEPPKYKCLKCQNLYEGNKCNQCQTMNPLFIRKGKSRRKKK